MSSCRELSADRGLSSAEHDRKKGCKAAELFFRNFVVVGAGYSATFAVQVLIPAYCKTTECCWWIPATPAQARVFGEPQPLRAFRVQH